MKDEILKPWRWLAKHPWKAVYIFLGLVTLGAAIGYYRPDIAVWLTQSNLIEVLRQVVGVMLGIMIALALLATLFL